MWVSHFFPIGPIRAGTTHAVEAAGEIRQGGLKHRGPGEEYSSVAVVCWSQSVTAHKSQLVNLQEFCKPVVKPLVA